MKKVFLFLIILFSINSNSQCVSTLAGSGVQGIADGTGINAQFRYPQGVAIDVSGNIYVGDDGPYTIKIRKITSAGVVTTLAGSTQGYADGMGTAAKFSHITAITVDASGNIFVVDNGSSYSRIRKITPSGVVTTVAGSTFGYTDGIGNAAKFNNPYGIAVDDSGFIYVADTYNNKIRKITPTGEVTTFSGSTQGYADGPGTVAQFYFPYGVTVDASGNIYVSDTYNDKIRKINSSGLVTTIAGSVQGSVDGIGTAAQFNKPWGIVVDNSGNLYVGDYGNWKIRKITSSFLVTTLAGGSTSGYADGSGYLALFKSTPGIAIDLVNNLYVGDTENHRIRKIITNLSANINYSNSQFCNSLTTLQPVILTGTGAYTGGTFSSSTGLSLNSTTGAITPSTSIAGTYTINYTTSTSSGCAYTSTTQVTITAIPTVSISYSGSPFCKSLTNGQPVTQIGTGAFTGGVYSSSSGLTINSSTGAITPSTSTPGAYTVSYSTPATGGCSAIVATTQITITAFSTASINYAGSPFCKSITTPQSITLTGTGSYTTGTFSSSAGLTINTTTGAITPSTSTSGNYTVTYTIPASGGCAAVTATTQIVILSVPAVSISADGTITTSISINNGNAVQLQLNGSFGSTPNIQWTPSTSISSTSISNPVVYPNTTTTYTASFTNSNGCQQSASIIVNVNPIPSIGNISLTSSNTTINLFNGNITVDVQISNVTNLYSLYMKLKSNAAVNQYLDYDGYTAGTLLGSGASVISTPPTVTNGVPDFGISKVGPASGYNGNGLFYTLRFKPKNITIPNGTVFCFYLDDINANNSSGVTCGLNNQGQICYTYTYQVNVWPGDLNKSNNVSTADLLPIGYFYNSIGPARPNATIQWNAQPATLWGYNNSTPNGDAFKVFADSNGDGIINNADQAAIGFNMGQVHARQANFNSTNIKGRVIQSIQSVGNLTVTPNTTIINGATLPQSVTFTVGLNNTGGLNALYGISVNLMFDETVFDLNTATVNYSGSIFGNTGSDCLVLNFATSSMISVGMTRYANAAIVGQGLLFTVTLQTKSSFPTQALTQVNAIVEAANNQAGGALTIQDASTANLTIINNLGISDIEAEEFKLYPNPVKDNLNIESTTIIKLITIYNNLGQELTSIPQNSNEIKIDLSYLPTNNYFIKIESDDKKEVFKIIKE
jgi:sugar lactone lactonase YvrE